MLPRLLFLPLMIFIFSNSLIIHRKKKKKENQNREEGLDARS